MLNVYSEIGEANFKLHSIGYFELHQSNYIGDNVLAHFSCFIMKNLVRDIITFTGLGVDVSLSLFHR
jgi:hypothetical protein